MMKLIYCCVLVIIHAALFAQNELPTGQIEVVKDFEVRLLETQKIKVIPSPVTIDTLARKYEYRLIAPSPAIEYVVPELKPLAINPEQKPLYYPLFAKAGYGSPNSLLANLSYDHLQSQFFDWGIDFRHLSANNKNIPLQKFSDSQGIINGSYLLNEKLQVEGFLKGNFQNVYFYGADEIPSNPESLKRSFNRYDLNFKLSNTPETAPGIHYMAVLNYLFDKDDLGSKERSLRLGGEAGLSIGNGSNAVGVNIIADLTKFQHTEEHSLNNILAEGFLKVHTGNLGIRLGALGLLKQDENELLPKIELTYHLFEDMVSIHAGWEGNVEKNNFHALSMYNPYIHTRLDSINNSISRKLFGGLQGTFGQLQFDVEAMYTSFERMAFFLQDDDIHEQFNPVYDDGSYFGFSGSFSIRVLKNISIRTMGYTRFYELDQQEKPWHRPSTGIDAAASYSGSGDLYHISAIFHAENGLPYRTPGGTELRLDPLLHLSFHGDYYFTSNLGAFVELNNVLGNNRERWIGYPSFGFNAKAGLMLRM